MVRAGVHRIQHRGHGRRHPPPPGAPPLADHSAWHAIIVLTIIAPCPDAVGSYQSKSRVISLEPHNIISVQTRPKKCRIGHRSF